MPIDSSPKRRKRRRLLLRPREAAKTLAISERLLWTLTQQKAIPCIRVGRAVRYDRRDLVAWIDRNKQPSKQQ